MKPKATKTKQPRRWYEPHSALGCLWRTVAFVLAMMLLYIIFGWIIAG